MVEAFKKHIEYLAEQGFKPAFNFNVIDNVASKTIRAYLKEAKVWMADSTERTIQTIEKHFISGLCIGYRNFLTILWCKLVQQVVQSLNVLQTLRVHPKLSANHVLEGVHDSNKNLTTSN